MADDFAELGLEGFDKLCDKDFYSIDKHAKALPKKVKNLGHSRKSSSSSNNKHSNNRDYRTTSTPYEGRDDPGYADPNLRRQERTGQDPYDDNDRYSDGYRRSAPYDGPRDEYDAAWYHRNGQYNDGYRGDSYRSARPRAARRTSSAGPTMNNERYASAGLDGYSPPNGVRGGIIGTRGGGEQYLHDRYNRGYSSDEYSDSPPPRPRARSAGRSRRSSRARKSKREDSRSQDSNDSRDDVPEKKRDNINASAWGAVAGGLLGSGLGERKGSPLVATFVGAGIGALGGKLIEKKDRNRRKDRSARDR